MSLECESICHLGYYFSLCWEFNFQLLQPTVRTDDHTTAFIDSKWEKKLKFLRRNIDFFFSSHTISVSL